MGHYTVSRFAGHHPCEKSRITSMLYPLQRNGMDAILKVKNDLEFSNKCSQISPLVYMKSYYD